MCFQVRYEEVSTSVCRTPHVPDNEIAYTFHTYDLDSLGGIKVEPDTVASQAINLMLCPPIDLVASKVVWAEDDSGLLISICGQKIYLGRGMRKKLELIAKNFY